MSLTRQPDPVIAAWLDDGPTRLSASAMALVKSTARTMPQRRRMVVPWQAPTNRPFLIAATAALAAAAILALAVGGPIWFAPNPEPSPSAVASPTPRASASPEASPRSGTPGNPCLPLEGRVPGGTPFGRAVLPSSRLSVEWSLPPETNLTVTIVGDMLSFDAGRTRGVLVVDMTDAIRHGSVVEQPPLGRDARTFLEELEKRFAYQGQVIDFDVNDVTATTLDGRSALSAIVTLGAEHSSFTHIDSFLSNGKVRDRTCAMEFGIPNQVIVADVGTAVVAVQMWAATESELAAWLPEARGVADALRIAEPPR